MERIEQLVSVDPAFSLVSADHSSELEKTLVVQRGQESELPFSPVLDSPEQHPTVFNGSLDDFTVGTIKIAGFAVQIRESHNFNLCFSANLEGCEAGIGKGSDLWEAFHFSFQLRIWDSLIWILRYRIMHSNGLLPAAPLNRNLSWHKTRKPSRRKLIDI